MNADTQAQTSGAIEGCRIAMLSPVRRFCRFVIYKQARWVLCPDSIGGGLSCRIMYVVIYTLRDEPIDGHWQTYTLMSEHATLPSARRMST